MRSMGRGDSLERQWKLMQLLEERRELTIPQVAEELGAAARTVYRDLSVLERIGVPIYPEKRGERSRWRVMDGYRRRLSLTVSWPELVALAVARDVLSTATGSLFQTAAVSVLEKIREALPKETVARADALAKEVSATGGPQRDSARSRSIVPVLIDAIDRHDSLRIVYRAPRRRTSSERTFDPYHLHFNAGATYVIGYVHEHGESRTYLVDRIREVTPTGQRFSRNTAFRLQDFVQGSFGPWNGRVSAVQLRFSASVAPYVAEKKVHPSQTTQLRDDGTLDFRLRAPLSPQLISWLIGFGKDVRVIAPNALAKRIREAHVLAAEAEGTTPDAASATAAVAKRGPG